MKIKFIAIFCLALLTVPLVGCKGMVKGSGDFKTRDFPQSGFSEVKVTDGFQIRIVYGPSFNVTITSDDNLLEHLKVTVKGAALNLGLNRADYIDATVKAVITMPSLHSLSLSGASTGSISGFDTRASIVFNVSGKSSLSADNMTTGDIILNVTDASKASGNITGGDLKLKATRLAR